MPGEVYVRMHDSLARELIPLLARRKGVQEGDVNAVKEPFLDATDQLWITGIVEFMAWFVRQKVGKMKGPLLKEGRPMRRLAWAALGTVVFVWCLMAHVKTAGSAPTAAGARDEILRLEEERNRAILTGDFAALDRMTSDDYTFITLRGELRTKSEIVKGFKSGSFKYESRQISDLNVRLYGTTAVVTGRSTQKGTEDGKDYSGDYRFTRVYVQQGGRWVTVALQTTIVQ